MFTGGYGILTHGHMLGSGFPGGSISYQGYLSKRDTYDLNGLSHFRDPPKMVRLYLQRNRCMPQDRDPSPEKKEERFFFFFNVVLCGLLWSNSKHKSPKQRHLNVPWLFDSWYGLLYRGFGHQR